MTLVTYVRDDVVFSQKPTDIEKPRIRNRLGDASRMRSATIEQLAEDCLKYTIAPVGIKPSQAKQSLKGLLWASQQLVILDVDNSQKIGLDGENMEARISDDYYADMAMARSICLAQGLCPAFFYTSARNAEEWQRYRIVFVLDRKLTDYNDVDKICRRIYERVARGGRPIADRSSISKCQMFFPGKEIVFPNYAARVNVDDLLIDDVDDFIARTKQSQETSSPAPYFSRSGTSETPEVLSIRTRDAARLRELLLGRLSRMSSHQIDDISPKLHSLWGGMGSLFGEKVIDFDALDSRSALFAAFASIPLDFILGLDQNFRCIFHNDKHPSASISSTARSDDCSVNHWRYFCHSQSCGFGKEINGVRCGDILDVVMALQNSSRYEALCFLEEVFAIKKGSALRNQHETLIDQNIAVLNAMSADRYPCLYRWIKRHIPKLIVIFQLANGYIKNRSMTADGKLVVSIPLHRLSERMQHQGIKGAKCIKSLGQTVNMFCLLGLISKLPESKIPAQRLNEARLACSEYEYHTSFYVINSLTTELLECADIEAQKCDEEGIKRSTIYRSTLLNARGQAGADVVFTQDTDRAFPAKLNELRQVVMEKAEKEISEHGFVPKRRLIEICFGSYGSSQQRTFGKVWPSVKRELRLQDRRATPADKRRLNLDTGPRSYPSIIIPEDN